MIKRTQFAVFADLHIDIMHDSLQRLEKVITAAQERKVDFIISLGDFTYPDNEYLLKRNLLERDKKAFVCDRDLEKQRAFKMLADCGIPVYHVIGNHEADSCSKSVSMEYFHMDKPYYSFDVNGNHFIVLDCNYIFDGERYIDYERCNYHYYKSEQLPFLPPEEMKWLESDIMAPSSLCVILSHQSLSDKIWGIRNREELWELFKRVNRDKRRVALCLNGHSHIDGCSEHEGVPFVDINSISNIWLGRNYQHIRYSEEIDKKYPYLKSTAPYADPLYAIVTMDNDGIKIEGTKSEYEGPSPYDLGFPLDASDFVSTPIISDRFLPL